MVSKKILFSLFFISSVLISGYYFYQRSQSKKEESYPVNNKEEVQEEEIQEETEEEAALVEINGWLDWFLLNTIFFFLTIFFLYVLFPRGVQLMVTNETNKVTNDQLKDFFFACLREEGTVKNVVDNKITELKQQFQEFDPKNEKDKVKLEQFRYLVDLYVMQHCFNNGQFFLRQDFIANFIASELEKGNLNLDMKFPITFFIISFIIIQILLGYDLYFFLKSFWQVGFSKTFENLHWLDLFSITKVFRRNSIMKKIAFLVALIFITGVTFVLASKFYEKEHVSGSAERILFHKIVTNREFNSFLSSDEYKRIGDEALDNLTKK